MIWPRPKPQPDQPIPATAAHPPSCHGTSHEKAPESGAFLVAGVDASSKALGLGRALRVARDLLGGFSKAEELDAYLAARSPAESSPT